MLQDQQNTWWKDTLFLTFILGGLFFILLGTRPLFVPDEGRYAEIAREMANSNDFITPYLNGVKYFEKPVLFYWLGAAAIKVIGLNLWSVRSINALLGLLGCLFTYFTARQCYDRATGLLAALILGTSTLYFVMAHMVSLDLTITVFLTACLFAFLLGIEQPLGIKRRGYFWAASAFAALAVLTKGLIGIIFPVMIIGTWIALIGEWRLLKRIYLSSCIVIFLLIATPWHILVGVKNPEFFYFYFIDQHFLRYTTKAVGHYQPFWFFIPCLILGFFPWIVFLPQALMANFPPSWRLRRHFQTELFFLLWAVLIFAFFSFSKSKLIPYILPVLPPLAILTARYLIKATTKNLKIGVIVGYLSLMLLSILIAYVFYHYLHHIQFANIKLATIYLTSAITVLIVGTIIGCLFAYRHIVKAIVTTVMTTWLFLLIILTSIPYVETRTILPFATILNPILTTQDEVITFNQYYQDLPFYLKRRVTILNWHNELTYGMQHQDTSEWMIDNKTFWQRWHSNKRVFVILSLDEYEKIKHANPKEIFYLLGETPMNRLISNQHNT